MEKFINRHEAGRILADQLKEYAHNPQVIVLALPRGGVPVGYEVAKSLAAPLDIFVVRKLGVPGHEELAWGALTTGQVIFVNQEIVKQLNLSHEALYDVVVHEKAELARRENLYRQHDKALELHNKIVIVVDDGIATGASMRAVIRALIKQKPQKIIIAVPVAAYSTYQELTKLVDEVICPFQPLNFMAVGQWYEDFDQTSDEEVIELLANAHS